MSETIRIGRKNAGLSQKALAKMCGLSQSTIARVEGDIRAINPSYQTIFQIAEALNSSGLSKNPKTKNRKAYQIMHKNIVYLRPTDTIADAIALFRHYDFPQLPVLEGKRYVVGTLYQKDLLSITTDNPELAKKRPVSSLMKGALPQISGETDTRRLMSILGNTGAVIVAEDGKAIGIITIYDVLKED